MIVESSREENYSSYKYYYQFYNVATIVEHVIQCFQTIVSDETNPYHPPLAWLKRKNLKPPQDELMMQLFEECSAQGRELGQVEHDLSANLKFRLEKISPDLRRDLISRTKDGCAPLFLACRNGYIKIVRYLCGTCGADLEQKGRYEVFEDHQVHSVTPIWMAAVRGNYEIVKELIQLGANINSLSDSGSTSLRSVCFMCKEDDGSDNSRRAQQQLQQEQEQQRLAIVDEIIDNDDNNNSRRVGTNNDYNSTISQDDPYFKIVRLLIDNGADVTKANYNGGTCLINSIHNMQLTQYILSHGADVNASDHQSKTALHYAIHQGRLEVTRLLLERGANPMLKSNLLDDALQLSCLGGHVKIFQHLITKFHYPKERLCDAYRLLGSSILERYPHNISHAKDMWLLSLRIDDSPQTNRQSVSRTRHCHEINSLNEAAELRRLAIYGEISEFTSEDDLDSMSADDYRMQSLLISERVLGLHHRETIQRLIWRGSSYINSLRPERCIDLWVYALNLRLSSDSIFQFESIFAAQAITKLFLDLISQNHWEVFKLIDISDVLELAVNQLDSCQEQLLTRPRFCLHEDIFDFLLEIIVNLMLAFIRVREPKPILAISDRDRDFEQYGRSCLGSREQQEVIFERLLGRLVSINPRKSTGCSLLHLCVAPYSLDNEAFKLCAIRGAEGLVYDVNNPKLPAIELLELLIGAGLDVDATNGEGLTTLQVTCLSGNIRLPEKAAILKSLIKSGAHLDRRPPTPEQAILIRQTLQEAGVQPINHSTLACLAARKLVDSKLRYDETILAQNLRLMVSIH